jgi:hypothetical protein
MGMCSRVQVLGPRFGIRERGSDACYTPSGTFAAVITCSDIAQYLLSSSDSPSTSDDAFSTAFSINPGTILGVVPLRGARLESKMNCPCLNKS